MKKILAMLMAAAMPLMLLHAVQVGVLEVPDELKPEIQTDLAIEGFAGCFIPVPNTEGVFLIAPLNGVDCKGRKPEEVVDYMLKGKLVMKLDLGGDTWRGAGEPDPDGSMLYSGFVIRDGLVWPVHFNFHRSKDFNADFRAMVSKISFASGGKKEAVGGGDAMKRFCDLDNADRAFKKYKPRPVPEFGPVKPPAPAIDLSSINEANYKAAATAVKAAMRELAGELTPEGEKEFEKKWSAVADYPDPKVLDYLKSAAPLVNRILDLRTSMVTAIQAYDAAAGEAVTARSFGDYEAANELMSEAGKQAAAMKSIEKAMKESLAKLEKLGDPPNPSALKEEASQSYRSAKKTVAEVFGLSKAPDLEIDGEYTFTEYMVEITPKYGTDNKLVPGEFSYNVYADKDYLASIGQKPISFDYHFTRPTVYFKVVGSVDQNHVIVYRADYEDSEYDPSWSASEFVAQVEPDGALIFYPDDGTTMERFIPQPDGSLRWETYTLSFCGPNALKNASRYVDEIMPAAIAGKASAAEMEPRGKVQIMKPTNTHYNGLFLPDGAVTITGKTLEEKQNFYREYGSAVIMEEFEKCRKAFECFARQLTLPKPAAANQIFWVYQGVERQPGPFNTHDGIVYVDLVGSTVYDAMAKKDELCGPYVKKDSIVVANGNNSRTGKARFRVLAEGEDGIGVLDSMTVERSFSWSMPPSVVPATETFSFTITGSEKIDGGLDVLRKRLQDVTMNAGTGLLNYHAFTFFGRENPQPKTQKFDFSFRIHGEPELVFWCSRAADGNDPAAVKYRYKRVIMEEDEANAAANTLDAERHKNEPSDSEAVAAAVSDIHGKSTAAVDAAETAAREESKAREEEMAFHKSNIDYLKKCEEKINAEITEARKSGDQSRLAALEFQRIQAQSDAIYEQDRINAVKTGTFVASRTPFDDMCQLQMRENTEKMIRNAQMLKRQQQYVDFYLKELDGPQKEKVYSIIDKINREDPLNPDRWAQLNKALDLQRYGRQLATEAKNDEEIAWAEFKLNAATNVKAGADTGMAFCSMFGGPQAIALAYQFTTGTAEGGLTEGVKRTVTMYSDAVDIAWSTYDGYQQGGWKGALESGGLSLFMNKGVPFLCEKLSTRGLSGGEDAAESAIKNAAKNSDASAAAPGVRKMGKKPTGDDVAAYMKEMDDAEKQVKEFVSDSLAYKKAVKAKAPQAEIDALERKMIASTAKINENPTAKGYLKYKAPKAAGAQYDQALSSIHERARVKYYEDMRARGFDDHEIKDFRNASSAGTAGMDYDQGLVEKKIVTKRADGSYDIRYELPKRNGQNVSRQEWMDNAQQAWEKAYAEATGGFSAKRSWENMTSSAHPEAYRQLAVLNMRKDLSNVDDVMRKLDPDWSRQTADVTMFKAGEMLNDPNLSRLAGVREACRGTAKDMKTKFLPMIDKRIDDLKKIPANKLTPTDRHNLDRLSAARKRFETVEQAFTDVGEANLPPTQWDDKIRVATGGRGIMDTIQDMNDIFVSLFPK
ncbi:MAG: hypothetical protein AB7F40_08970 [Victivallaceae bacterium]|nr:hypothetical protein [Victivallaceae bacterium]